MLLFIYGFLITSLVFEREKRKRLGIHTHAPLCLDRYQASIALFYHSDTRWAIVWHGSLASFLAISMRS